MGSRSRSHSKSRSSSSASRSRSKSKSRSRSPRSRSRSGSYDTSDDGRQYDTGVRVGTRVHVGSLSTSTTVRDLHDEFGQFGEILDAWVARAQPCFAFVVFRKRRQALKAISKMDGETIHSRRIRVSMARPRTRGTHRGGFNPDLRCYQCGKRGHFSRHCRAHQWSPNSRRAARSGFMRERHDRDNSGRPSRDSRDSPRRSSRPRRRSSSSDSGHGKA